MPDNGAGTYTLPQSSFVSQTTISSSAVNSNFSDIAAGLNGRLTRNGESAPSANLPMAGFRHTGVGDAASRTSYAAAGQVQDSALVWGGTSTGSANAQEITLSPGIGAYVAGQRFAFLVGFTNTNTPTLAVSGLAAKTIVRRDGSAVAPSELTVGDLCEVVYDGTNFRLLNLKVPGFELINSTVFNTPTNFISFDLPTRYNRFRLEWQDTAPASSAGMYFRVAQAGVLMSGGGDYTSSYTIVNAGAATAATLSPGYAPLTGATTSTVFGTLELQQGATARWTADTQYTSTTPSQARMSAGGVIANTLNLTEVGVGFVLVNTSQGRIRLFGSV